LIILTVGCGEKKTSRQIPPPPPLPSQPDQTVKAQPQPEAEQPPETKPEEDELAKFRDAKPIWTEVGTASWYGPPYHNRRAANGEIYNQDALTAAHRTLPMGSIVRVINLKTDEKVIVKITDRGPFIGDRIIDLSLASAKAAGVWRPGLAKVRLEVLYAPKEIDEGGRWCVQVGAFTKQRDAIELKEKLQRRYHTAKVLQFPGPTGYWVRVRVLDDTKDRAEEVAKVINIDEGGVFLVRLD
jgi:rare lipoprotein A